MSPFTKTSHAFQRAWPAKHTPLTGNKVKQATHLPPTLQKESSDEGLSPGEHECSIASEFCLSEGAALLWRGPSLEKAGKAAPGLQREPRPGFTAL